MKSRPWEVTKVEWADGTPGVRVVYVASLAGGETHEGDRVAVMAESTAEALLAENKRLRSALKKADGFIRMTVYPGYADIRAGLLKRFQSALSRPFGSPRGRR